MGTQGFTLMTPAEAAVTGLLALRVSAVVWTAPLFSSRAVPATLKSALTVLLVVALWPVARALAPDAQFTAAGVATELTVGVALGLGAAIFVGAAESAGDMLAVQMGLSGANVVDPMSATQLPVLGHFLGLFVTALILAGGGHLVILEGLAASHALVPSGAPLRAEGVSGIVSLGATLLWIGLRIAAPVIAAMILGNVALGVLARTVPQLNVLMVAFPMQIGIGLFVLAAALPLVASAFAGWGGDYTELAGGLLRGLAPAAPGGP